MPTVIIGTNGGFNVSNLAITNGSIVNFENDDCCSSHTINSDYPFTSVVGSGLTFSFTFNKPGLYAVLVDDNQSAKLTVIVT
jgi:plastocyanin